MTRPFALGGTYDRKLLFGSFALKYVGRQYATFMNDESIAGYATLDLSIGVHLARWLGGKGTPGKFAETLKSTADFLVEQRSIRNAPGLDAFQKAINTDFIRKAVG